MEPNKIEKQFREKLNSREIQPSAQAWDRLDAMLSVVEEKKTKRPFGFLFVAAGILVLVTLGLFLFNQDGTEINTQNSVVGIGTKRDTIQNPQTIISNQKQDDVVSSSNPKPKTENRQSIPEKIIIVNQGVAINHQKANDNQNQIDKNKEIEFMLPGDVAVKDISRVSTERKVVDEGNKSFKSDEALLADLDKRAKQSANQRMEVKVDSKSLLSQAEGEVEYTFREKVINKVNKNYQEVKVALANRNKE